MFVRSAVRVIDAIVAIVAISTRDARVRATSAASGARDTLVRARRRWCNARARRADAFGRWNSLRRVC
jgi:hypothetical protein